MSSNIGCELKATSKYVSNVWILKNPCLPSNTPIAVASISEVSRTPYLLSISLENPGEEFSCVPRCNRRLLAVFSLDAVIRCHDQTSRPNCTRLPHRCRISDFRVPTLNSIRRKDPLNLPSPAVNCTIRIPHTRDNNNLCLQTGQSTFSSSTRPSKVHLFGFVA